MTQEERGQLTYNEAMDFMAMNHRNPSRHRLEEHLVNDWIKHNREMINKEELKERVEAFWRLLAIGE